MNKVLITGTGLIGGELAKLLDSKGFEVTFLSTSKNKYLDFKAYRWNILKNEIDLEALNVDYIIHLSGANIGSKRWTNERKKEIIDSRVASTNLLFQKVKENNIKLKAFICASATGYYGAITSNKIFQETDTNAEDFVGITCKLWEKSSQQFKTLGIRTVNIRTAVVLSKNDGAFSKILMPIKKNVGAPIGDGQQFFPWIHIYDLCNIYLFLMKDHIEGAFNACAPEHINNHDFTHKVAAKLNKAIWLPNIPVFIIKLLMGNAHVLVTKGSRISSQKLINQNFEFKYGKLEMALDDLLN